MQKWKKHLCSDVFVCVEGKFLFICNLLFCIISRSVFIDSFAVISCSHFYVNLKTHHPLFLFSTLNLRYLTSPPRFPPSARPPGYSPAWDVCSLLGQCEGYGDLEARQELLAFSLTHCPPDNIHSLLAASSDLQTQVTSFRSLCFDQFGFLETVYWFFLLLQLELFTSSLPQYSKTNIRHILLICKFIFLILGYFKYIHLHALMLKTHRFSHTVKCCSAVFDLCLKCS